MTLVRSRPLSALIVGATGRNVLRIVTAFEVRRILTLRADTIAVACERVVVDMPHVVLALVAPATEAERDALLERALAVGALVVQVDPTLGEAALQQVLETTIHAALQRKLLREAEEVVSQGATDSRAAYASEPPIPVITIPPYNPSTASDVPPDLDDGWND